jgi:UDP-N-acetylglucosamine--N-acetylmuramyl-(pentapeptide) pyrophosphoryl-undecaprenol N-acetylglucosamine transferase
MSQQINMNMTSPLRIVLAAGGTGGHLFPASALAEELKTQGHEVMLATDKRGMAYQNNLTAMPIYRVPAATVYGGGLFALPARILTLLWSVVSSLMLMLHLRPAIIIGFGGYPSFGPVMAGLLMRKPVLVHEQNAVLGRANRLAVKLGASLATSFPNTAGVPARAAARMRKTGNPLRADVLSTAQISYRSPMRSQAFDLLVFGGSQGARIFSTVVPEAIALLPEDKRENLRLVQQVSKDHMAGVLNSYGELKVSSEIREFFDDMPRRLRHAHLVICRGGASTISEISALGVPSIIVPLPGSLDQDQANNARDLATAGAAELILQKQFNAESLAAILNKWLDDKACFETMSTNARRLAEPEATVRLARYAYCLAQRLPIQIDQPASFLEGRRS